MDNTLVGVPLTVAALLPSEAPNSSGRVRLATGGREYEGEFLETHECGNPASLRVGEILHITIVGAHDSMKIARVPDDACPCAFFVFGIRPSHPKSN